MIKDIIATKIRTVREQKGFSQEKMAWEAHISTRQYSRIETAEHTTSIHNVFKIARALGIHYSELQEEAWQDFLNNPDQSDE